MKKIGTFNLFLRVILFTRTKINCIIRTGEDAMFRILCLLKSNQSYKRIVSQFDNSNVLWEENISSFTFLQEKAVYTTYQLAVVDEKLTWGNEAIAFLEKMRIPHIFFTGDFDDIGKRISENIPEYAKQEPEEEVLKISTNKKEDTVWDLDTVSGPETIRIVEDVKYMDKKVEVPIYRSMYGGIDQQTVVIANLSRRAGASFITINFARMLAKMKVFTSVIEPPFGYPYMFNAIGIDKKIDVFRNSSIKAAKAPGFYSYPHAIVNNEHVTKNRESIIDDIIWIVPDPRLPLVKNIIENDKTKDWDYLSMIKLTNCTRKAPIRLVDIGSYMDDDSISQFLPEADLILVIVDPSPADCMENLDKLNHIKDLKEKGLPIMFVANKWSLGVDEDSFTDFLKEELLMKVPYISPYYIYQAVFDYKIPYDLPEVEELLSVPFTELAKLLLPKEIIAGQDSEEKKDHSKLNILSNLLRRKKE